jgi:cytochrome c biogenesis protein
MGSAGKNANNKDLKNVGPSVSYKLRDKTGQAREYQNYMQPVTIDGATVFLAGMRASPSDLQLPAHSGRRRPQREEWMRLRAALQDPELRAAAASAMRARAPRRPASDARSCKPRPTRAWASSPATASGRLRGHLAVPRKMPAAEQEKPPTSS